jgi:hypothetical protein
MSPTWGHGASGMRFGTGAARSAGVTSAPSCEKMGIEALYQKPRLSKPHPGHTIYPYLLKGVTITQANFAWASDITYIPMAKGFCYLVAIMDLASRKVLSWRVSNTLDTSFCIEALEEAIKAYGTPEIFNTDQGSQFTSDEFTGVLKDHGIKISMDGKGRWMDNGAPRSFTEDEGRPLQSRPAGGGSKPPQAAAVKSCGGERWGKGEARPRQVRHKETNGSEPLMTCRKSKDDVETRGKLLTWDKSGRNLLTARAASGMKAA